MRRFVAAFTISLTMTAAAEAQNTPCGGDFGRFVQSLKAEAVKRGYDRATIESFFAGVRQDRGVLAADRRQGIFKTTFTDFSRRLISQYRLDRGRELARKHDALFDAIERQYGVPRGILLAFLAFETDFGAVQGDFNTRDALVTLAHDCRRPEIFRPQVFAALELHRRGDFPTDTTGAWAGEIGMVQMLPRDILERGVDGDGDGHVRLKTSLADALFSGANMLREFGWRPNEPWLEEVSVPADLPWHETGLNHPKPVSEWARMGVKPRSGRFEGANLKAAILLPQGRKGPAFLAYPNFSTLFEWNMSMVYVTTAAYFATRLEGAPIYNPGNPDPGLSDAEMRLLQQKLAARGHDVGGIDGILGEKTREAVQIEQRRLGLPADAWPTRELLNRL
ncbi:lytic murein transglycosylase [Meinhardsimonia xiamenensis]|jgi:lytic murein transglycosylase|uniref:Lytic murein transglycosylase n=1 Tax=Meinhardsimonia xiamenensis TaxID=990712 RepID=A0A1G8XSF7_9RHOB|nr:lytic murein transglycosylase [Meinhardsimonia xiamenensis]PRX37014.1 lytic murein transglycosylase [Meinhardsimonia xiamenensis]SDJ93104.1 lytic murein transglycosylase [Meinhardsimonia xiamenensis]